MVLTKLIQKNRKQIISERVAINQFWVFWKQVISVMYPFWKMFVPLGQLLVVSSFLNLGLASKQSMSFHDVTTATKTASMALKNIEGIIPQLHDVKLQIATK